MRIMIWKTLFPRFVVASLGLSLSLTISATAAPPGGYDPSKVSWSKLYYKASKLGFSIKADVEMKSVPKASAAKELLEPEQGTGLMSGGDSAVFVALRNYGLGPDSDVGFWLDPTNAAALQRTQLRAGKRPRHRTYRFTETGLYILTKRPADGQDGRPYAEWSDTWEDYKEAPPELAADAAVTEASGLFYVLSTAGLSKSGDKQTLILYSKDTLMKVELKVVGAERIKVDYVEESGAGSKKVKGNKDALRISVVGRPLFESEEEFEFLGLRGDISLYLDPETRVLLQMSGKIKKIGTGHVKLKSVTLN